MVSVDGSTATTNPPAGTLAVWRQPVVVRALQVAAPITCNGPLLATYTVLVCWLAATLKGMPYPGKVRGGRAQPWWSAALHSVVSIIDTVYGGWKVLPSPT